MFYGAGFRIFCVSRCGLWFPLTGAAVAGAGGEHGCHSIQRFPVLSEASEPHPDPIRPGL